MLTKNPRSQSIKGFLFFNKNNNTQNKNQINYKNGLFLFNKNDKIKKQKIESETTYAKNTQK